MDLPPINTDNPGLLGYAASLMTDAELKLQLADLDGDLESLRHHYSLLAERARRTYPDEPLTDATIRKYLDALHGRYWPYTGAGEQSLRVEYAKLLDVPLGELTGQPPEPGPVIGPAYRLVADGESLSEEALGMGLLLLVWLPRRRLRPFDAEPFGPGEAWQWPARTCVVSVAVWSALWERRRELTAAYGEWFATRFECLMEPAAPF